MSHLETVSGLSYRWRGVTAYRGMGLFMGCCEERFGAVQDQSWAESLSGSYAQVPATGKTWWLRVHRLGVYHLLVERSILCMYLHTHRYYPLTGFCHKQERGDQSKAVGAVRTCMNAMFSTYVYLCDSACVCIYILCVCVCMCACVLPTRSALLLAVPGDVELLLM